MKKVGIIIVVCILLCICVCFIAHSIYNNINQNKPLKGNEEMYALTEQEIVHINDNSNFLGCVLLDESCETTAVVQIIRNETKDYYMCFPYRDGNYITTVNLFSKDANFYGISIGDSLEKMAFIMEEQGFLKQDSAPENTINFRKYYIAVSFMYDDENVINSVSCSVIDPVYIGITY